MTSFSVSLCITMTVTPPASLAPPVAVRLDARNAQNPDIVTQRELFSSTPLALRAGA